MSELILWLQTNWLDVVAVVLAVHTIAVHVTKWTPTDKDDKALAAVVKVVAFLAGTFIKPKA